MKARTVTYDEIIEYAEKHANKFFNIASCSQCLVNQLLQEDHKLKQPAVYLGGKFHIIDEADITVSVPKLFDDLCSSRTSLYMSGRNIAFECRILQEKEARLCSTKP